MSALTDRLVFWRPTRIAVIELAGLIAARPGALSARSIAGAVRAAFAATPRGGALVLDINSPGGSPVQSELIASLIRREAERRAVRVHAVIQDVGASGGYWLACAADRIHASPMSVIGSIGVIGGGFGFPRLLERYGVERRLYSAGTNKARLDPFTPERSEDVAFIHGLLGDIHETFKSWVRTRRGSRLAAAEDGLFDGSYHLGAKALDLGLIDALGDLDGVVRALGGQKARARRFRPQRRRGLARFIPGLRSVTHELLDVIEERRWDLLT